MRRILILDVETTGLDPAKDSVIEVAAILYSVEHATVLSAYSSIMNAAANPAEAINRIPPAALTEAPTWDQAWSPIGGMLAVAGAIVAHSAGFDRSFAPLDVQEALPWICSKSDLQWPKQTRPEPSLVALALEHDLGVATAHRAMADCDLLARLFTRARELGADLQAMLARGLRPKAEFVALVSYDDREKAKTAGFQWDGGRKEWRRRMAIDDAAALPFRTRRVEE